MSRRRVIVLVAVVASIVVLFVLALGLFDNGGNTIISPNEPLKSVAEVESEQHVAKLQRGVVSEVLLELGDVEPSTTTVKEICVVNKTDAPIVLLDYQATCRCVWLDLPKHAIAPEESAVVKFFFDSRGEYGSIGNYISVMTSDNECEIAIWMSAEV